MRIPLPKLKATLLYFCHNTDPKFLGKVKLMKLFYFLDFSHLKRYGAPVTFDTYINLEHGPIPSGIKSLVDTAADDPDNSTLADTIAFERPAGTNMYRILPRRAFTEKDSDYFSGPELETLKKVCARFGGVNTQTIEDASHKESPWQNTKLLEEIPYTLAAKDKDCLVTEDDIDLLLKITGIK